MKYRYEVGEIFAKGAQGQLIRAKDRITGNACLLKIGDTVRQEAILALRLNHPYILQPLDIGVHPELGSYCAFPEIEAPSLLHWVRQNKSSEDFRRVVIQIAEFLSFLHHRRYLYNDFKPDHFLISDSEIRVLDLGLCSPFAERESSTFSGTFPYISPERLAGRAFDQRSDIFAFGMLLLHLFSPHEDWNLPPDILTLQKFLKNCQELEGDWKSLIADMTAFEPNQRIENAHDVWKRLLPPSARSIFLFFPPAGNISAEIDSSSDRVVQLVTSTSALTLRQAQTQALLQAWEKQRPAVHIDFQRQELHDSFINLLNCFEPQSQAAFLPAIEKLQEIKTDECYLLLFAGVDLLPPADRASFAYAVSSLASTSNFVILITSKHAGLDLPEDIHTKITLPLFDSERSDAFLKSILPDEAINEPRFAKMRLEKFISPEQILEKLREELPEKTFAYWPAAAKTIYIERTVDSVSTQEMRVLACIAVAGGSLHEKILESSLPLKDENQDVLLEHLQATGFLQKNGQVFQLSISPIRILNRLRKDRVRDIAANLIQAWSVQQDPATLYVIAHRAGKQRLAALYALRAARAAERQKQVDSQMEYYWKAHLHEANLNKARLLALLKHSIRHAEIAKARKLYEQIKTKYGMSYRMADLALEIAHRTNDLTAGEELARRIIQHASQRDHRRAGEYFTARLGVFCQLQLKLEESTTLSKKLLSESSSNKIRSLARNNLGVADFYKGDLTNAIQQLKEAIRVKYAFRPNSYMTLGVAMTRQGNFAGAKKWLGAAIHIFNRRQDTDRLSVALSNLGVVHKQAGELKEARACYQQSLHLSRLNRNRYMLCMNLNNLAVTYELEGRTDRAIRHYARSARIARAGGMKRNYAIAKANAGLQYAFQNRFSTAVVSLNEAIRVYKELKLKIELAEAYEYLGITFLLSGHLRKAEVSFKQADRIFQETGTMTNVARIQLFNALLCIRKGLFQKAKELIHQNTSLPADTFEKGLYEYCNALLLLTSPDASPEGCRESLHEAERIFRKLPSAFWLAKNYQLKLQYYLRKDHFEKAHLASTSAFNIFSRIGSRKEILKLTKDSITLNNTDDLMNRMADRLPYKILQMISEVLQEREPQAIIAKTLAVALEFTDMERALLIVMDDPPRIFKSTTIDDAAVQEIYEISNSAIQAATQSQKPYVALDAVADPYLKSRPSIVAGQIMSIVCLPLRAQNDVIAVLYLDSREGVETLGKTESILLEIFASLIALVLNKTLVLEKSLIENRELRSSLGLSSFPEIIGNSETLTAILKSVHRLLTVDIPVLITGETGTGKELIARVLHYCGSRKNGSFIAVNCSALSKTLLETELFGHEKGAFTGADSMKKGLFEQAKSGTLFLDEIGDMPHSMQAKLLRVLQEGEFRRVGGNQTLRTDARIILATNRNLQQLVKRDQFREDLYYRIKAVQIHLPPLRERVEDIPLLATHFLKASMLANKKKILGFTPEAQDYMKKYTWPGNARQLKNEVERIVALTEKEWIDAGELDPEIRSAKEPAQPAGTLKEREKQIILEALEKNNWNILQTARALGLTRNGLYGKMKMHGVRKKVS